MKILMRHAYPNGDIYIKYKYGIQQYYRSDGYVYTQYNNGTWQTQCTDGSTYKLCLSGALEYTSPEGVCSYCQYPDIENIGVAPMFS